PAPPRAGKTAVAARAGGARRGAVPGGPCAATAADPAEGAAAARTACPTIRRGHDRVLDDRAGGVDEEDPERPSAPLAALSTVAALAPAAPAAAAAAVVGGAQSAALRAAAPAPAASMAGAPVEPAPAGGAVPE